MPIVFSAMGTVVSLTLCRLKAGSGSLDISEHAATQLQVRQIFDDLDRRFSLYRDDSELSAIANGALSLPHASAILRDAYAEALLWRQHTGGAFTPHRPDGVIDLNGTIKATAMRLSAEALHAAGIGNWCLNVGGDVCFSGSPIPSTPEAGHKPGELHAARFWRIGIVDPLDRGQLLCTVAPRGTRTAVATSGNAERGGHIWGTPANPTAPYSQVTVIADDIVTADVLATAIVAGGVVMRDQATEQWPIDVLTVGRDGTLTATPGFRAAMDAASGSKPQRK